MTISFPLAFPTVRNPVSMTLRQKKVVAGSFSPGSLVPQIYEWPGERWELDMAFNIMERQVGAAWVAWLMSLRSSVGSFLAGDPTGTTPLGTAGGSPVVSSTTAAGSRTLPISGGTGTLLAGSMFSIGTAASRRLYMNMTDVANLASATLDVWPALRTQATASTPIILNGASGLFMFVPGKMPEWQIDIVGRYHISPATAYEDLR